MPRPMNPNPSPEALRKRRFDQARREHIAQLESQVQQLQELVLKQAEEIKANRREIEEHKAFLAKAESGVLTRFLVRSVK